MVRKKMDPFWKHVEIRPKDRWRCKFCGNEYSGRVIRIKAHLGQVKNRGIDICNKVDDGVKEQALKALNLEPTQRQDMVEETAQRNVTENISSIPPVSNFDEGQDLIPSMYIQNVPGDASHDVMLQLVPLSTEFGNVGTSSAALHTQFQSTVVFPDFHIQQHGGNSMMDLPIINFQAHNEGQPAGVDVPLPSTSSNLGEHLGDLKRKVKRLRNENEEKEEELHHRKKKVKEIENVYEIIEEEWRERKLLPLQQVNQLEILIKEVEGLGIPGVSTKALSSATHNNNHPLPLITTELIGRESEMLEIWNYLVQDDILRVGIYGMGGVGKTEVAMHIYNKLLENEGFDHVFWATIPQDFTIYEIQEVIGNAVHLDDLLMEKNEKIRAAMLHRFLISKKKSVLILDGLWRPFEFYDVGIPVKFHGLKLIITSRSLDVCRMMLCQVQIRISPLLGFRPGEHFKLFLVKLGLETELPSELKEIAVELVSTCKGLPLYITAIARRMRGVKDVRDWKDMLVKMKDPKERLKEMKYSVYDTLKLSYDSLDDHQMQQCLIFSAFYISSKGYTSKRGDLVEALVDVGLILGKDSRTKSIDKAHGILDKLENASLLYEKIMISRDIEMHDSIIDMALNIKSDKVLYTSHSAIGLKDVLDKDLWFEGIDDISFIIDGREESSNGSINFSKISFLWGSYFEMIPDLLLRLLPGLRILDLSYSYIEEIPHSVSDLTSLTALVLRHCEELVQIPYIGKLTLLQKLDLYGCSSLTNLPDGLEFLVKLECLNLYGTGIENLPKSILGNLRKLQYLLINYVEVEGLVGLNMLELLWCSFSTVEELSLYARNLTDEGPSEYHIRVERSWDIAEYVPYRGYRRAVSICEKEGSHGDFISLPKNIQFLRVDGWSNERIMLSDCASLESLEEIEIRYCMKFGVIFGDQNEGIVLSNSNACPFPNLKELSVSHCSKLKYIFGPGLVSGFSSLNVRQIIIEECENLEGIIAAPSTIIDPRSILGNLRKLRCRGINHVKAEELVGSNKLESLRCSFSTVEELSLYARNLTDEGPSEYNICVGRSDIGDCDYPRAVSIYQKEESYGDCIYVPKNIQFLRVDGWSKERIMLSDCASLENLAEIEIRYCMKFGVIFGDQNEGFVLSNSNAAPFPNLKKLHVVSCSDLKYIFGPGLVNGFSSLNARELIIDECENLEGIIAAPPTIMDPRSILGNLRKLQFRGINHVKAEELVGLNKLESLRCSFSTVEELSLYAHNLTDEGPSEYNICVGRSDIGDCDYPRAVSIYQKEESQGDCISLPKNIQLLRVDGWSKERIMLSDCASLEDLEEIEICYCMKFGVIFGDQNEGFVLSNSNASPFPNLKKLTVVYCSKLKYIFDPGLESGFLFPNVHEIEIRGCKEFEGIVAAPSTIPGGLPNLEKISMWSCRIMRSLVVPETLPCLQNLRSIHFYMCDFNLKALLTLDVFLSLRHLEELGIDDCLDLEMITQPASHARHLTASATTHLTSLIISGCRNIKRLLSHELLVSLSNLQTLEVCHCNKLEELTDMHGEQNGDLCTVIPLPNLKRLSLESLPELRSIDAISIGSSIVIIKVKEAPQLKRIPLQMSQLPNGLWDPPSSLKNIIIDDKDWWESLEWESQGVKDTLQKYVQLKYY